MALNLCWNVWTIWEIFYNEVGLVESPSMILFCKLFVQKFQKMLPKMIYWSPHRPINETGPRQLILTSNIKHHKTRSNIGIALSAVQYLGGLRMDARTLKEANFREGRDHYYNWTMDIDCSCNCRMLFNYICVRKVCVVRAKGLWWLLKGCHKICVYFSKPCVVS